MPHTVIIIGAGAAGLLAAYRAAGSGARTIVLEKNRLPGRKLLVSGSGRCNLTNTAPLDRFIQAYFDHGRFLHPSFQRFFRPDLAALLQQQGLALREGPGGKLFPASDQAADVLEALLAACRSVGVQFRFAEPVLALVTEPWAGHPENEGHGSGQPVAGIAAAKNKKPGFTSRIRGVRTRTAEYLADAVILACGGSSWPGTGSNGDGCRLAQSAGHRITPLRPALVPFNCKETWIRSLSGISCPAVSLSLQTDGRQVANSEGDLLWTHTGVSGPAVLRLSRACDPDVRPGECQLAVNLCPEPDEAALYAWLKERCRQQPRSQLHNALSAEPMYATGRTLPRALAAAIIRVSGAEPEQKAADTADRQLKALARTLQQLTLTISGTRGYREAMVTAGGIDLREIDPRTLMSRRVHGLFAAGEVLDVDGDTGGYNLQAAFSTGFLAGESAAALGLNRG